MAEIEVTRRRTGGGLPVPVIVLVVLFVAGAGAAWYFNSRWGQQPPAGPVITPEAKAYVRNLKLTEVEMKAHESYLRQQVVEIVGKIENAGGRPLKLVEINCIFYDPYGQVVLRERVAIVRPRAGELKPGESRSFRLPFDNLPESWNQGLPQLVIAQIVFG